MNDIKPDTWRGHIRKFLVRLTYNPIQDADIAALRNRIDAIDVVMTRVNVPELATSKFVSIPKAEIGDKGKIQLLEQKLSALQTRVDMLTLQLAEARLVAQGKRAAVRTDSGTPKAPEQQAFARTKSESKGSLGSKDKVGSAGKK